MSARLDGDDRTARGCDEPNTPLHPANDGCSCDCGRAFCVAHYDAHRCPQSNSRPIAGFALLDVDGRIVTAERIDEYIDADAAAARFANLVEMYGLAAEDHREGEATVLEGEPVVDLFDNDGAAARCRCCRIVLDPDNNHADDEDACDRCLEIERRDA